MVHEEAEATAAHEAEVDIEEVAAVEVDSVHRVDTNRAEGKFSHLAYCLSISGGERWVSGNLKMSYAKNS